MDRDEIKAIVREAVREELDARQHSANVRAVKGELAISEAMMRWPR